AGGRGFEPRPLRQNSKPCRQAPAGLFLCRTAARAFVFHHFLQPLRPGADSNADIYIEKQFSRAFQSLEDDVILIDPAPHVWVIFMQLPLKRQ
ncbi:hypothetical protein, partial [Bordetella trematum]|uniref:hypothetical protein n=1 Tax=Bordetella trematum TaxID=123899 RepID=UPI00194DE276